MPKSSQGMEDDPLTFLPKRSLQTPKVLTCKSLAKTQVSHSHLCFCENFILKRDQSAGTNHALKVDTNGLRPAAQIFIAKRSSKTTLHKALACKPLVKTQVSPSHL